MTAKRQKAQTPDIRREKTAMQRHSCSRPIAVALADGVISKETSVFDYGCGQGDDLKYLRANGVRARGWDPHFKPKAKKAKSDVVNLGYVLNVIEDPAEREKTARAAFDLAEKVLVVSVRVDKVPDSFKEFGDGYITSKDTFQKLYSQGEFKSYIEQVLVRRAQIASLGIAYVFKDDDAEANYLASRVFSRRLEYRTELIEEFSKHQTAKSYVRKANAIGRLPQPDEFRTYDRLLEAFGTQQRIERLALRHIDPAKLLGANEQRREDILTYFAMLRLQGIKLPKFRKLPTSVQRDIKAIWPSYKVAQKEADSFLFAIGRPELIKAAIASAQVGKKLPEDFYIHKSVEDSLPPLLRIVLFAAHRIIGTVEYDVVKIASDGRAVSFLQYNEFDTRAHPELQQSVRVYLPRAKYGIRQYQGSINPPILHRKDALVQPSYSGFPEFQAITKAEEELGLLGSANIGRREDWEALLREKGLRVVGHSIEVLH